MNDQDLETRLTRSLDRQAGGLHDAPFTFDDVRGRARGLQRRRRAVAAGVAAVVLAVAVPIGLSGGSGDDDSRGIDPAPAPHATTADASVLHGRSLTFPDGRTAELAVAVGISQVGVLSDGRIIAPVNGGGGAIRVMDHEGRFVVDYPALTTVFTMGADDRTVAWTDRNYRIHVLESGVEDPVTFPGVPMEGEAEGSIDAVLGSDCAGGGCRVLAGDGTTTSYEITLDGAEPLTTSEPLRVEDVSPDGSLWSVRYADDSDPQYGCSGLYDVVTGTMTARTCETTGLRFSPDGQHLLGTEAENNVSSDVTVLDLGLATTVLTYEPRKGAVISRAAWADAGSLYLSVVGLDGADWTLQRQQIDNTGSEVLDGPGPGGIPEDGPEYLFSK